MKKAVILINKLTDNPAEDEQNVLDQANEVELAMSALGYEYERLFIDLDLSEIKKNLLEKNPGMVFNLVEGIDGKATLIYLAPALLESMKIPYTGCRLESMFITSNKILTKKILEYNNINTASFYHGSGNFILDPEKLYIVKPLWEDASVGITDSNVFRGRDSFIIDEFREKWGASFFVEEFISGREFNVSLLGGENGPQVMPLAEMTFRDYPADKPRIVGYEAKWKEGTFEYENTERTFEYSTSDNEMRNKLKSLALKCWDTFGLKGYARVDFRVDDNNEPFVLEINANPCLSRDAGLFVSCEKAGLTYEDIVRRIIYDAFI